MRGTTPSAPNSWPLHRRCRRRNGYWRCG